MEKLATFLSIIMVLSLICGIGGCTPAREVNQTSKAPATNESKQSEIIIDTDACPKGIIPDRWNLDGLYGQNRFVCEIPCPNKFADGTLVDANVRCERGSQVGQNTNYIYCNTVYYKKQQVNPDGIITESIIKIDFVFDSRDKQTEGYKVIKATCRS
jgi:hypothetical protein